MKNIFKKILLILLIALSSFGLIGCSKGERLDNAEFNDLLDTVCLDFLGKSPLIVNKKIKYPEKLGLTDLSVEVDAFSKEDYENYYEDLKNKKELILEFEDKCLSKNQLLTKKIIIDYIDRKLLLEDFYGYESKLNTSIGYHLVLPFYLGEYRFDDLEDINNYFDYLRTTKETFENMILYETMRSDNNMGLTDTEIDMIISQCENLINQEENDLIEIFNQKITETSFLNEEQKISLKDENLDLVNNDFINAYKYLKDAIISLKGKTIHNGALCNYPNGKEYYEAYFKVQTGSDMTVLELEEYFKAKLTKLMAGYKASKEEYQEKFKTNLMEGLELDGLIEFFIDNMTSFPKLDIEIEYVIKDMDKQMQQSKAAASYLNSPIDANVKEIICLNRLYLTEANNALYQMVAHEGFPGHLYQYVYFKNKDTHNVRKVISYLGYTEGWAKYIEIETTDFVDSSAKKALEYRHMANGLLTCLLDIKIHYHGWSIDEAYEVISPFYPGYTKEEFEEWYNAILIMPTIYLPYYYGYFQVQDLKRDFKERLGKKYSDLAFHKAYLDIGPAPFSIVKSELEKYQ